MRFSKRMNVFSCDRLESRAHRSFILKSFVSNSVNVSKLKRTNFLFLNLFEISLMLGIFIRCRCSCYHCKYYNLTSLCVMFHIFSDGISRIRWTILAEFWQLSSLEETCLYINNKHKEHVCMLKRLRGLFICEASFWSFCKRWENTSNKTPKINEKLNTK